MQPWRQRRRSRRGGAVLSAGPRHPGRGSAAHADRRVPARGGGHGRRLGDARASAAAPRPAARESGGVRMAAVPFHDNGVRSGSSPGGLDPRGLRREFPIFEHNPGLVFLDSGASAQKPRQVIDGIAEFYRTDYANVHRGVSQLSARSTDQFEEARETVRHFLNAADERFFFNDTAATEAINLVAQSWGPAFVQTGDEVVISDLEHHSNLVPWQMLCRRVGARLVVAP